MEGPEAERQAPSHASSSSRASDCRRHYQHQLGAGQRLTLFFIGTLRRSWQRLCASTRERAHLDDAVVISYSLWPYVFGEGHGARNTSLYAHDLRLLLETLRGTAKRHVWLGMPRLGKSSQ